MILRPGIIIRSTVLLQCFMFLFFCKFITYTECAVFSDLYSEYYANFDLFSSVDSTHDYGIPSDDDTKGIRMRNQGSCGISVRFPSYRNTKYLRSVWGGGGRPTLSCLSGPSYFFRLPVITQTTTSFITFELSTQGQGWESRFQLAYDQNSDKVIDVSTEAGPGWWGQWAQYTKTIAADGAILPSTAYNYVHTNSAWYRYRFCIDFVNGKISMYMKQISGTASSWALINELSEIPANLDWNANSVRNPLKWNAFLIVSETDSVHLEGLSVAAYNTGSYINSSFIPDICPAGSYCPTMKSIITCPAGQTSPAGSSSSSACKVPCSEGYDCTPGSREMCVFGYTNKTARYDDQTNLCGNTVTAINGHVSVGCSTFATSSTVGTYACQVMISPEGYRSPTPRIILAYTQMYYNCFRSFTVYLYECSSESSCNSQPTYTIPCANYVQNQEYILNSYHAKLVSNGPADYALMTFNYYSNNYINCTQCPYFSGLVNIYFLGYMDMEFLPGCRYDCLPGYSYRDIGSGMNCNKCAQCPVGTIISDTCRYAADTVCDTCPAGSFCPNNSTMILCSAGYYCPQASTTQTSCTLGSYCPAGSTAQTQCPGGNYCQSTATIAQCQGGFYCPPGTTAQIQCPSGSFCGTGVSAATACTTLGSYCAAGSSSETQCLVGYYCQTTSTQTICTSGNFCPAGSASQTACPATFYCPTPSSKLDCPAGSYCPTSTVTPIQCPAGSYCGAGVSAATACSLSNYCPAGSSTQTQCPLGYYCQTTSTQTICTSGNFCPAGSTSQTACPATFYCPTPSSKLGCPAGSYCPTSTVTPIQCPAGSFCSAGVSAATACSLSNYCPAGSASQTQCPTGFFCQTPSNQTACAVGNLCPAGSVVQSACQSGTYSADPSSSTCLQCAAGKSSYAGAGVCCSANFYAATGSTTCTACPQNSWSAAGAGKCTANVGYFFFDQVPKIQLSMQSSFTDNTGSAAAIVTKTGTVTYASSICDGATSNNCKKAALFGGGSTDMLLVPNSNAAPFTLCFWMRVATVTTFYQVAGIRSTGTTTHSMNIDVNPSGSPGVGVYALPGISDYWGASTDAFVANTWVHLSFVFEESSGYFSRGLIYRDGVQKSSTAHTGSANFQYYTELVIGASPSGGRGFSGYVSDVRLYPSALTANQVAALYASYSTASPYSCSPSCAANTYGHCTPSGTAVCCGAGKYFVEGTSTTCQTCPAGTYALGNTTACTPCPANTASAAGSGACCAANYYLAPGATACAACPQNSWSVARAAKCTANVGYYDLGSSLMAYYPFNNGNVLADISGVTGALTASVSSPTSQSAGPNGAGSYSVAFVGSSSQYFSVPSVTFSSSFTICSWYYIDASVTPNYQVLFAFESAVNGANDIIAYLPSSTTQVQLNNVWSSSALGQVTFSGAAATKGGWYHIAIGISGTSGIGWLNGAQATTVTFTSARSPMTLQINAIGRNPGSANGYWTGAFDEFRIYNRLLTSTEVQAIYSFNADTNTPLMPLTCSPSCLANTYGHCTPSGTAVCCGAGTYFVEGSSTSCLPCPAGTYSVTGGQTSCTKCAAPNTYSTSATSASFCVACAAGTGLVDGVCVKDRVVFGFDSRKGDPSLGPDGSVQYASMPLGNVIVSSGTTTVNGFTIPRGIQIWTVKETGTYDLAVAGGKGGDFGSVGGSGMVVSTKYSFTAGQKVAVLVGQAAVGCTGAGIGPGGGATFVSIYAGTAAFSTASQHTLIAVAGGGGGSGADTTKEGANALSVTTGAKCRSNPATASSSGGSGGGGGALAGGSNGGNATSANSIANGAGGGGFLSNGGDGWYSGWSGTGAPTYGGQSFLNGGAGGWSIGARAADWTTSCVQYGGFGGGGGSWNAGAGGGGYSGGQGCASGVGNRQGGGGGGSYDVNGVSYAATQYTSWNTTVFGTIISNYSAGLTAGDGFLVASACPAGTYSSNQACNVCPVNTFSLAGATACTPCAANTASTAGSSACVAVPGFYKDVSGAVLQCPANTGSSPSVAGQPVSVLGATVAPVRDTTRQYARFTGGGGTIMFPKDVTAQVLVVGGGGSGGSRVGGGGGAGALIYSTVTLIGGTTYSVTVGAGGASSTAVGNAGSDSSFVGGALTILAKGGGGGASTSAAGNAGGCSSGSSATTDTRFASPAPLTTNIPYGTYGSVGGAGTNIKANSCASANKCYAAGGGGGVGSAGYDAKDAPSASSPAVSGGGGAGVVLSITGDPVVYAAGGGGGGSDDTTVSNSAGGGASVNGVWVVSGGYGTYQGAPGGSAVANSGSGGGGTGFSSSVANPASGAGAAGVVVVAWDSASVLDAAGCVPVPGYYSTAYGTVTGTTTRGSIPGGNRQYVTFTGSGTITFPQTTVAQVLVVGGGGSGGCRHAGGGGAGAVVYNPSQTFTGGVSYTVAVGTGGAPVSTSGTAGNDGALSSVSLTSGGTIVLLARGGGGGGQGTSVNGRSGGCSGGASASAFSSPAVDTTNVPQALSSGFIGGAGTDQNANSCGAVEKCYAGGGGGGAGGGGGVAANDQSAAVTNGKGGYGGNAFVSSITGVCDIYAGGGGGGANAAGAGGAGGGGYCSGSWKTIGGAGGLGTNAAGGGAANTGSGGGGSGFSGSTDGISGAGGSGVVIIAFESASTSTCATTSSCAYPTPYRQCTVSGGTVCCGAGTYWVPSTNAGGCTPCPLGTYGDGSQTFCTSCPAGTFAGVTGSSACQSCAAGMASSSNGAACYVDPTAVNAPVGQYYNTTVSAYMNCTTGYTCAGGSALPVICPAGWYCNTSTQFPCSLGNFCPAGSIAQTACPATFYCPTTSSQLSCTAGNMCPVGSTAQIQCPAGSFCVAGVSAGTACSLGNFCPAGSTAPTLCALGSYCVNSSSQVACDVYTTMFTGDMVYPPKRYDTTSNEEITTVLGQSVYKMTMTLNQTGITRGNGTYELYYSSKYPGIPGTNFFSKDNLAAGFAFNHYNASTGASVFSGNIVSGYTGDWLIVKFPRPVILTGYMFRRNYAPTRSPAAWKFYGSNTLTDFTEIVNASTSTQVSITDYISGVYNKTFINSENTAFSYIGITFSQSNGELLIMLDEIEFTAREPYLSISFPAPTCPAGSTDLNLCPLGSYCPSSSLVIPCNPGDYCIAGSSAPSLCPQGYVCPTPSVKVACDVFDPLTEEREYPPTLYDSYSDEVLGTYLGKNNVYMESITLNSSTANFGQGNYFLYSSSSYNGTRLKRFLFNKNTGDHTAWGTSQYDSGTGAYKGVNYIVSNYKGDWIVIKFPYRISLTRFQIFPVVTIVSRAPSRWKCYGSNDGLTFTEITGGSMASDLNSSDYASGFYEHNVNSAADIPYQYIGFTFGGLLGPLAYFLNFYELKLFGKELSSGHSLICPQGSTASALCPVGSFCPNATAALPCTPPNYCAPGSPYQTLCPAGYVCPDPTTKLNCPANQYCLRGVTAGTNCGACATGQYVLSVCSATANIACSACTNLPLYATYTGVGSAATNCPWMCNPGYFLLNNNSICAPCPANSWCIAGTNNLCPSNTLSPTLSASQNQCLCAPGYFGNGSRAGTSPCPICTSGSFCPGGNGDLIVQCPVNFTSPPGSSTVGECVCQPGYRYTDNTSSPKCELCVSGELCFNGLASACPANSLAPPGSFATTDCVCVPGFVGANGGVCVQCPANYVCTGGNAQIRCTANAVSPVQSINSSACYCDRGYQGVNNATCTACPPNTWCWTGILNQCPPNTSSPTLSNYIKNCTCNPGFAGPNGTACSPCSGGTYNPLGASANCSVCPVKSYCPLASVSPRSCPVGFETIVTGAADVSQCTCSPGYYGAQCNQCPRTAFCPGGSSNPVPCPNDGYSLVTGSSSADLCLCPANSALVSGICTCTPGYQRVSMNESVWICSPCPANQYCKAGVNYSCPALSTSPTGSGNYDGCTCDLPRVLNAYDIIYGFSGNLGVDSNAYSGSKIFIIRNHIFPQFSSWVGSVITSWTVTTTRACTIQPFYTAAGNDAFFSDPGSSAQNYYIDGMAAAVSIPEAGTYTFQWSPASVRGGNTLSSPLSISIGWYDSSGSGSCIATELSASGPQLISTFAAKTPLWQDAYYGYFVTSSYKGRVALQINTNPVQNVPSVFTCVNCAKDMYYAGKTSCSACPPNTISLPGSASVNNCTCNSTWFKLWNASGAWTCSRCVAGSSCANDVSTVCPVNTYCPAASSTPTQCPALSDSLANSSVITDCKCPNGYSLLNGVCAQCGYGTYAARGSVGPCIPCPFGSNHSISGSSSVSDCKCLPGFYGDTSIQQLPLDSSTSLIRSCNSTICPVTALYFPDQAIYAVDGTLSTRYVGDVPSAQFNSYSWIRIDFKTTRKITNGRIWALGNAGRSNELNYFQVWVGDDSSFPGKNQLAYQSPNARVLDESFLCPSDGRYVFIVTQDGAAFMQIREIDIMYTQYTCAFCPRNAYCPSNSLRNYTVPCPNSTYSQYGASSASQCVCPQYASFVPELNCTCDGGRYKNPNMPALGGWDCEVCLAGSWCYNGSMTTCPNNTYCPAGSPAPTQCPVYSTSASNSSSLADCLCQEGYRMVGAQCVPCGNTSYTAIKKGVVGSCTPCPGNSFTLTLTSTNLSACKCLPGFTGDSSIKDFPGSTYSLLRSCNNGTSFCPVKASSAMVPPEAAIDGSLNTPFATNYDISKPHWWRIDFQEPRVVSDGMLWTQTDGSVYIQGYTVWVGNSSEFMSNGTNIQVFKSTKSFGNQQLRENFTCGGVVGRYVFVSLSNRAHLTFQEIDFFFTLPPENRSCTRCTSNSYCPGGAENLTIPCPNAMYSLPGSSSIAECSCPANSALVPELNCTCNNGYYRVANSSAPLGGWQCNLCPKGGICNLGNLTDCPPGFHCPNTGMSTPTICPVGAYCPQASVTPTTCPAETYANETGLSACLPCTVCQIGSFQNTPCTATQNRACTVCVVAKPAHAIFASTSPSCPWVCDNGYWGSDCDPCPANYWCKFGVQNRCPLNSVSPALSGSQSGCVCGLGYMSTGRITGTSPCVKCPAGVLCNGVPVKEINISTTPLVNVTTQVLLAQKPLPPANSMVSLFTAIPDTIASIRAALPNKNATVYLRQVCRRTYCVACDEGTAACIRYVTVRMQQLLVMEGGGGNNSSGNTTNGTNYYYYTNTTSSLKRDVMYTFVNASAYDCVPQVTGLSAEFVSNNVVVISSVAAVASVRVACSTNSSLFVDIPVDAAV